MKFFSVIVAGTLILVSCNGGSSNGEEVKGTFNSEETEVIENVEESVDEVVMTEEEKINFINEFKPGPEDENPYNIYALYDFHVTATEDDSKAEGERQLQVYRNFQDNIHEIGWTNININNIPYTGGATEGKETEIFGVEELPAFVVLDEDGVAYIAYEVNDVLNYVGYEEPN
ncbi:hypothetical protein BpOF4_17250 [Alkalihalophilus pseudofirmus OF4]|uniref:Lipoprotein n=1 Tax=Alkalihalophilus pseudofirmus (strain ATCC BAA-2126 / JCM 17055 / OF4) TaxID=398511 RepID=D3FRA0_ALKPO|nr:hypothetical protein [Alkalihalophilus pseudofirmus]ADC51491.1 hypothetical protein BpOF4_17250 [Alkalihalophilus pseudofirmus OF4]